jgi:hypothetical protein
MYDAITKMKLNIKYMERGIIPIGWTCDGAPAHHDFNRYLSTLPPSESRAMKRKFRKEWRKIVMKSLSHGGKKGRRLQRETTTTSANSPPTRRQRIARKSLVVDAISRELRREEARR